MDTTLVEYDMQDINVDITPNIEFQINITFALPKKKLRSNTTTIHQ